MAMDAYFYEYIVREQLHKLAAIDRRLTSWRWFQPNAHPSHTSTWRVQFGQTLIRLGCWLQRDSALPAGTSKEA
jgi:hypothetical protein